MAKENISTFYLKTPGKFDAFDKVPSFAKSETPKHFFQRNFSRKHLSQTHFTQNTGRSRLKPHWVRAR